MAREQFFLDNEEDTIHANPIVPTTAKEKRANWWFYHKVHLIVGVIAVVLLGSFVYSIVSKVEPDYTISIISQTGTASDVVAKLEEELKPYADDRNGDGQVVVHVSTYNLGSESDPQVQQADMVRLIGGASSFDSVLYLSDPDSFAWLQEQDGFFTYTDGTTPKEGATDYENMRIEWSKCKGLTGMDLSIEALTPEQAQKYMSGLSLSVRMIEGTSFEKKQDKMDYYQDCWELFQRLVNGEKLETEKTE